MINRTIGLASTLALLGLCGCGEHGTPEPGHGAAGLVNADNAGAAQPPTTPPLAGGMEGQTPIYPEPGYARQRVYSGAAAPPQTSPAEAAATRAPASR